MKIVDAELLRRFRQGGKCEHCGRLCTPEQLDPHHWWKKRGIGGGTRLDVPENLVALCRGWEKGRWVSCHEDAERGLITKETLLALVAARHGTTQDAVVAELERLAKLPKGGVP